jgi:predicted dehydrogenase
MGVKKKLGIGVVGCGFMGRAHSNAFGQVGKFFELEFQPVLTAACARNADSAEALGDRLRHRRRPAVRAFGAWEQVRR